MPCRFLRTRPHVPLACVLGEEAHNEVGQGNLSGVRPQDSAGLGLMRKKVPGVSSSSKLDSSPIGLLDWCMKSFNKYCLLI
jgi:hypothetical protein